MKTKRIIPCLDVKDGKTVKGVNFVNLRDAGDPVALAQRYEKEGADELVFLDITATLEKRQTLIKLVSQVADAIHIPFTVGGGIDALEIAQAVIKAGADKISLSSAAIRNPALIRQLSKKLGKERVVVAVDTKADHVYVKGGTEKTDWTVLNWAKKAEFLGAGELLLTSMDHDGTKNGFALELTEKVAQNVNIPVIASGGAGKIEDFINLFQQTKASAGLAASVFHFGDIRIGDLKNKLKTQNINVQ